MNDLTWLTRAIRRWFIERRARRQDRRHAKAYPRLQQVIYYHDNLVRVVETDEGRDDVMVVWYDDEGRHQEWVSWLHCCERV